MMLSAGRITSYNVCYTKLLRRVYGVESQTYCAMHQRLRGLPVEVGGDTIAEGLAVRDVGELTLEIVRRLVDEVLLVGEETISYNFV